MHSKIFATAVLALAPMALAQSGVTSKPSATPTASGAPVVTMMWDNEPTGSAGGSNGSSMGGMNGMSMEASMTMSKGKGMGGMSMDPSMTMSNGRSMTTATGTAMAGMSMSGSAGRAELAPSAMGVGWFVVSFGAGIGFLAGML